MFHTRLQVNVNFTSRQTLCGMKNNLMYSLILHLKYVLSMTLKLTKLHTLKCNFKTG